MKKSGRLLSLSTTLLLLGLSVLVWKTADPDTLALFIRWAVIVGMFAFSGLVVFLFLLAISPWVNFDEKEKILEIWTK